MSGSEGAAGVVEGAAQAVTKVAASAAETGGIAAGVAETGAKATAHVAEKGGEEIASGIQNATAAAENKGVGSGPKPAISSEADLEARVAEQRGETAEVDAKNAEKLKPETHSDEFYRQAARAELAKGLPQEIKDDPKFKEEVDKIRTDAQKDGRRKTPGEVEEEALANFIKSKDSTAKPEGQEDQLLNMLKDALKDKNFGDLRNIEAAVKLMTPQEQAMLEAALEERRKKEKEEPLLKLILRLFAIIGLAMVVDVGQSTASTRR